MQDRDDPWRSAGTHTRAEVREIFARHAASAPSTEPDAERFDPLPAFLLLPRRGWRALSPRGRIVLAALVVAGLTALALAWPTVERDKRIGAEERARELAASRAATRQALIEDQRPRRAELSAKAKARIAAAGGLESAAAAAIAGAALERGISRDVRGRIQAGTLDGPLLETTCDPVRARSATGASYNCFALRTEHEVSGRKYDTGYRFSARAELPAGTLVWCKENLRALHPTTHMITVPISPECRA
jgi:hypothetical protein